jgi:hypothetical protein
MTEIRCFAAIPININLRLNISFDYHHKIFIFEKLVIF